MGAEQPTCDSVGDTVVAHQRLQPDLLHRHLLVRDAPVQPHSLECSNVCCMPRVEPPARCCCCRACTLHQQHPHPHTGRCSLQVGAHELLPRPPVGVQQRRCHLGLHCCDVCCHIHLPDASQLLRQAGYCCCWLTPEGPAVCIADAAAPQHKGCDAALDELKDALRHRHKLCVVP